MIALTALEGEALDVLARATLAGNVVEIDPASADPDSLDAFAGLVDHGLAMVIGGYEDDFGAACPCRMMLTDLGEEAAFGTERRASRRGWRQRRRR